MATKSYFWNRNLIRPYWKKITDLGPIAYWMQNDTFQSTCSDSSRYACHGGGYGTGITLEQTGIGDGQYCSSWDGTANAAVTLPVTNLATVFDGALGSITAWIKVANAGVWTDGTSRQIIILYTDSNNYVRIRKTTVNNQIQFQFISGFQIKQLNYTTSDTGWCHVGMTWNKSTNTVKFYWNGILIGSTTTAVGAWAGALVSAYLGRDVVLVSGWKGNMQHVSVYKTELTQTDITNLYTIVPQASIDQSQAEPWGTLELQEVFTRVPGSFVVPEWGNEFSYQAAVGTITINSGAAMVKGCYYENSAPVSIALTATVNPRIDCIVLRKSTINQTVRLTKIIGAEAANPTYAIGTDDILLWWIYLPGGYNPATTAPNVQDIHDERPYKQTAQISGKYANQNVMHNSEFCAYSGGAATNLPPEKWNLVGAPTTIQVGTRPTEQPRGNGVAINAPNTTGMTTRVLIPQHKTSTVYTVKGLLNITAVGTSVLVTIEAETFAGATANTTTCRFNHNNQYAYTMRLTVPAGYDFVRITITSVGNSVFTVGQILLINGYIPGPFRAKHEIIWFEYDCLDANWTATAKSTGTTTINLAAAFGNVVPSHVRAVMLKLRGNDSSSAAGAPVLRAYHLGDTSAFMSVMLNLTGIPNDKIEERVGFVGIDQTQATSQFGLSVTASGAGAFDATVQLLGVVT